jgi:hypothetical protein
MGRLLYKKFYRILLIRATTALAGQYEKNGY